MLVSSHEFFVILYGFSVEKSYMIVLQIKSIQYSKFSTTFWKQNIF
uniref:ORF45g n=1 Tax=Pinus koraiensis TaxID=88728 RepID=A4QMD4_PINKO|nr:ORF45g [Pinus koraiensis]ABP35471.1 ORF45g [Pinus koraiensis]